MEPAIQAVKWEHGSAEVFLKAVRDESGLLTGWSGNQFGFMHLGFQEYLTAREIRRRHFDDDHEALQTLARNFGDSWWQEVILLLLALEDPSVFKPLMRAVTATPAFAEHPELLELCLTEASEISLEPFMELVRAKPAGDRKLWLRQHAALNLLWRFDQRQVEDLAADLSTHPSADIRKWLLQRIQTVDRADADIIISDPGGYELVRIPGGVFSMGSPKREKDSRDNEKPMHKVQIKEFFMGRYPVTNEAYGRFLKANPDYPEPDYWGDSRFNGPHQPVVGVSWKDAQQFAAWAGLVLPSEAQWEYACRAGTKTRFYTGNTNDDLKRAGWYGDNSGGELHPVGEKEPNDFGLYDMHGNVLEWAKDDWHENYKNAPKDDIAWTDTPRGRRRVMRGGGFGGPAEGCRSAFRGGIGPDFRIHILGFRLALPPGQLAGR